jgi:hypothetical protein
MQMCVHAEMLTCPFRAGFPACLGEAYFPFPAKSLHRQLTSDQFSSTVPCYILICINSTLFQYSSSLFAHRVPHSCEVFGSFVLYPGIVAQIGKRNPRKINLDRNLSRRKAPLARKYLLKQDV